MSSRAKHSAIVSSGPVKDAGDSDYNTSDLEPYSASIDQLLATVKPSYLSLFRFTKATDAIALAIVLVLPVIAGALGSVMAIFLGRIVNCISAFILARQADGKTYNLSETTLPYLIGILVSGLANVAVWLILTFGSHWFAELQIERARCMILQSLMSKDNSWYDFLESPGALVSLTQKFLNEFHQTLSSDLIFYSFFIWKLVFSLCIAMYYSWKLTLVILAVFPLLAGVQFLSQKPVTRYSSLERKVSIHLMAIVDWTITSIPSVKLFNSQFIETDKFSNLTKAYSRYRRKSACFEALHQSLLRLLVLLLFLEGFWYGGHLVRQGEISSGSVLTVFWACNTLSHSISNMGPKKLAIDAAKEAAESLWVIIGASSIETKKYSGVILQECQGDIEFKNITFAYPSRPCEKMLDNVGLRIPANEMTFIVGGSGSGKSTLHALLLNLYSPQSGRVSVDGINVDFLLPSWLRRQVTVVQQESVLFRDTIANNIRLGAKHPEKVDSDDIKRAVRISMLAETVNDLPDGIDTFLAQGGAELSGGQRQRVALARAIIRDTPVLVLDEAMSALDIISRGLILDAVKVCRRGLTTIVITHDIAQIGLKDRLVVMKDGKCVQQGFRADLESEIEGPFARLVTSSEEYVSDRAEKGRNLTSRVHAQRSASVEVPESSYHAVMRGRLDDIAHRSWDSAFLGPLQFDLSRRSLIDPTTRQHQISLPTKLRPRTHFYVDDSIDGSFEAMAAGNIAHLARRHLRDNAGPTRIVHEPDNAKDLTTDSYARTGDEASSATKDIKRNIGVLAFLRLCYRTHSRKSLVIFGLATAILNGISSPLFSYVFVKLLYSILPGAVVARTSWDAIKWPLAVLGVSIIDTFSLFGHLFILDVAADHWVQEMRNSAFRKILARDWSWFFETDSTTEQGSDSAIGGRTASALTETLVTDAETLSTVLGGFSGKYASVAVLFFGGLIGSIVIGWQLALVAIAVVPIPVATSKYFNWVETKWCERYDRELLTVNDVLYEVITKVRTVKTLALETHFRQKHNAASRAVSKMGLRRGLQLGIAMGLNRIGDPIVLTVMFYYGTVLITKGSYSVLRFLTVTNLIAFAFGSTSMVLDYMPNLSGVLKSGVDLVDLAMLDGTSSRGEDAGKGSTAMCNLSGDIRFESVGFTYPGRDAVVLQGINLSVSPGEIIAIAGSSGCGKSTLASMISRLLIPTTGRVAIGGTDIMSLDVAYLRRRVAVVSQSSTLFNGTILDNLTYGLSRDVSLADVEKACLDAGIHEFISSMGEGYNTAITSATSVSGGQAQRLAIARALLRAPSILILDECTSALDATSAEHIRQAVKRLKHSKVRPTVITVSHSRDMMECADRIVVMNEGRIAEIGEFMDLMQNRHGYLANLINGGQWA